MKQWLKLKTKTMIIGTIHRGNSLDFVRLNDPLYGNFYLTYLGIFRFDNPQLYNGCIKLDSPNLTLPTRRYL